MKFEVQRKRERTSGILQRLLFVFLIFVFLLTAGSLLLRHSIAEKLTYLSVKLKAPPETGEISNVLLELSSAENDFQQASLYGYGDKLDEYQQKVLNVFTKIDTILHEYPVLADTLGNSLNEQEFKKYVDGKLSLSLKVFALKKSFDSLLVKSTEENILGNSKVRIAKEKRQIRRSAEQDTIIREVASAVKKKGFLKRLKQAFSPGSDTLRTKLLLVARESAIRDSLARELQIQNERGQQQLLERLSREHNLLAQSQQQLISSNLSLIIQLRQLIDQIKDNYLLTWERSQRETLAQYEEAVDDLDNFTVTAIIMVLIFVALLLIYIKKASRAEDQYKVENARAIALAEQKSEMLATMSHEIRNPLTAITGFVYLMKNTPLTAEQNRMVSSIKASSDMLMDTVNDILDMTKVESQQSEVLKVVSFTPFYEIKETVETMRFIAIKKNISLSFNFDGSQDDMVYGDPFRLKQVVINLVGNAIKYTDIGGVEVHCTMKQEEGEGAQELTVRIKDSGIGIPQEQQGRLFTKYYQAGKDNTRPGTGLGLYICYQLIKLQRGDIEVESEEGKGSIFSFRIPFKSANV
ncbi:HAMP domain-containing sensor histidine kinase [Olivibacter sp. CPCC 100613]|uniref:sensor histidine kinase n=1 Tax=Olivibacter sp. CPCC 100613 TaxID=3079931 RepID=UPI002FF5EA8E